MGVVLLSAPGVDPQQLIGEAFQIDNTRRLWTEFYNTAGGGRGKVCTELLPPLPGRRLRVRRRPGWWRTAARRGQGRAGGAGRAGHRRDQRHQRRRRAGQGQGAGRRGRCPGVSPASRRRPATLAPGQTTTVKLPGRVTRDAACGQPLTPRHAQRRGPRGPRAALAPVRARPDARAGRELRRRRAAAGWRVNPDGTDTGARRPLGARARPQRSVAFDYTLQPGAAFSGTGAFVTGPDRRADRQRRGQDHAGVGAVRGDGACASPHLSYQVYFVAADFDAQEVLVPGAGGVAGGAGLAGRAAPGWRSTG